MSLADTSSACRCKTVCRYVNVFNFVAVATCNVRVSTKKDLICTEVLHTVKYIAGTTRKLHVQLHKMPISAWGASCTERTPIQTMAIGKFCVCVCVCVCVFY